MTEALIGCVFVLVPLFLAIPLLGKYIDIKHAAVQSARYQAWEYTVWRDANDTGDSIASNFDALSRARQPFKEPVETQREAENRFFGRVGANPNEILPLSKDDRLAARQLTAAAVNPLWVDHRKNSLFDGAATHTMDTDMDTPTLELFGLDIGGLITGAMDVVDLVAGMFSGVLSFLGNKDAAFTAINTDGLVDAQLSLPVRVRPEYIQTRTELAGTANTAASGLLAFNAKAAVLSEGWNSGGTDHTYNQANGTTPVTILSTLLDVPVLDQVWDILAIFAPELTECTGPGDPNPPIGKKLANATGFGPLYDTFVPEDGSLWLGYVDGDVVHPDRLSADPLKPDERLGSHICDDAGICTWDDDVMAYADPAKNREPLSHSPCKF